MIHLRLAVIYLSFISLGLPDGLLGAAWPSIYPAFGTPMSYAGIVSIIICIGTILSSLFSDRFTYRFGPGKVTALSIGLTCLALFGFSFSTRFWMLCLWAIPYGLGAGCVDATLNNYVALHYSSRHMSWLHCMWGVGASIGPYIVGLVLTFGQHWGNAYRYVGILQVILAVAVLFSLPLWKKNTAVEQAKPIPLQQVIRIPGAKSVMLTFFCYCALEQTAALWSASYLHLYAGLSAELAASFGSLFFLGITAGRAISGFIAVKLNDTQMIRVGFGIIAAGLVILLLPFGTYAAMAGLLLIGLGCAPIYPCVMHATPEHFGPERSQALMGLQTASAYVGTALMPPLFGLIANHLHIGLMGIYLAILLVLMVIAYRCLLRKK